jgi:two-component system, response regulator / RNA-binding antiterminator
VDPRLSLLVIDESLDRASLIVEGFREAGRERVIVVDWVHGILKRVEEIAPEIIVNDLANVDRDLLAHMILVSRTKLRKITEEKAYRLLREVAMD